jgi:DNA-binding transcriptional ArsR family regulator
MMRAFKHPAIDDVALEDVFYALSDPVRLEIVLTLARDGEASCSALDGGRPKSSMSHHFRVLRDAGLVRTRSEGTQHLNALRREELDRRFPGLLQSVLRAPKAKARVAKQGN